MKYGLIGIAAVAAGAMFALRPNHTGTTESNHKATEEKVKSTTGNFEPVAVIELFTSQGCSSCPPADRLLAKTIAAADVSGKKIFALSFHVDYWNRLGWPDPFSAASFTKRQSDYVAALNLNGAYTPQMIVNGTREFTGSDQQSLSGAMADALNTKAEAEFTKLDIIYTAGKPTSVEFALKGNYKNNKINIALIALEETTIIKRGENGGITLKNDHVIRQFQTVNAIEKGAVNFTDSPLPSSNNFSVIAYVQEPGTGKIIGAAKIK